MVYGGYDPTKSFWQNLQGTVGTIGGFLTPNVYAGQIDPVGSRPINPQGTPSYIPPEQEYLFSGGQKGYQAPAAVPPAVKPPQVTPTSPWTSAPAPQPQQQQQQGGQPPYAPNVQNQTVSYGGNTWKGNPGQGWTLQGPSGGGAPQGPDLNSIYDPAMQSLNAIEQNYRNQLPGALQSIEASYGQGSNELDQNLAAQNALLGNQATNVGTAKANALAQARQLYVELSQRNAAMFGSRSSAGPAAQELLGRATTQQFGNVETGAQSSMAAIDAEKRRILDFTNVQKDKFALAKADALRQTNNDFTNKLAEINSQRGALESAKATARVQALEAARAATAQIAAAEKTFQNQITMFEMESQRQLANKAASGSGFDTAFLNATGKIGDILGQYGPDTAQAAAKQAGVPYNFAPQAGYDWVQNEKGQWVQQKKKTDTLWNPFD